jgi:hypothetical protein
MTKYDREKGIHNVDPVDCQVVIAEVIVRTASEALPVNAISKPSLITPHPFHRVAPFSSAKRTASLDCAFAAS